MTIIIINIQVPTLALLKNGTILKLHTILQGKEFLQANVIVWAFDLYFVGRYSHKIQWCLNDA